MHEQCTHQASGGERTHSIIGAPLEEKLTFRVKCVELFVRYRHRRRLESVVHVELC
jgi:hypothetical protein